MGLFRKDIKEQEKREKQKLQYEQLLEKFHVPESHFKVVIGQSKVYNVYNCPAILWMEGNKIKTLIFRINPVVTENDPEDFMFISSQPYVDFIRFDGTEYPDWARQSAYVKEQFLPYVEQSITKGGLDYKRQMYWIGTMCVYARSLAECLKMLGRPLSDYELHIDKKERMREDGSIPEALLEEYDKEKADRKAKKDSKTSQSFESPARTEDDHKISPDMAQLLQDLETSVQAVRKAEYERGRNEALLAFGALAAKLLEEHKTEALKKAARDMEYLEELLSRSKEKE